jgi:hypothetical protein
MIPPMIVQVRKFISVCGLVLSASACAGLPDGADSIARCEYLIDRVDQRVADRQAGDAEAAPVQGFPYLRVNRFLASFRGEVGERRAFAEWVRRLRALDREARQVELQNLGAANITSSIDRCADLLLEDELKEPDFKERLIAAARPPTHYDDGVRALGFYPLTHIGVALGFERWKADNLPAFAQDASVWADVETAYSLRAGTPPSREDVATLIALSAQNALDIPDIKGSVLASMAARYAPVFAVEETSAADQIGRPFWFEEEAAPRTDLEDPTLYVRLAHTKMDGAILPQLVYTVWFPARPTEGPFDILGGALDGLVWRVTLDRDGEPLIYDSFHACGCYHLFFPADKVARVPIAEDDDLREEPLTPRSAPILQDDERVVLHIAAGSHYLRGLSTTSDWEETKPLRAVDEHAAPDFGLRSLEGQGQQRRSLFGPDGIVPGTERTERFILWPMGIASPGAMRQWGTHATAFVGERHADGPFLFDRAFQR